MILLVRVDDRLLHGQIICSWVPYLRADLLVVASDEAAGDALARDIMASCACSGLSVEVETVSEAAAEFTGTSSDSRRAILIVGTLSDAMRIYELGSRFKALNIGNIHHERGGRAIAPSVIIDGEDEDLLRRFVSLGVSVEIRDVPASAPRRYVPAGGA